MLDTSVYYKLAMDWEFEIAELHFPTRGCTERAQSCVTNYGGRFEAPAPPFPSSALTHSVSQSLSAVAPSCCTRSKSSSAFDKLNPLNPAQAATCNGISVRPAFLYRPIWISAEALGIC